MKLWINFPSDQDIYSVGVFFHLNKHDQNIYLDTKINHLLCQRAKLHLEVALDHVLKLFLLLVYIEEFWNLFQSTQHDQNIYLDTKINLLVCQRAELHLKVALGHVVEIVLVVDVHWGVLKSVPIKSAWSKTYIWIPKSTFYNARELSYNLNWPWTMLLALFLVLV